MAKKKTKRKPKLPFKIKKKNRQIVVALLIMGIFILLYQYGPKNAQQIAIFGPAAVPTAYNPEMWRPIIAKYPWPVDQAMLVMTRESKGNPRAVSKTDDHGLFQIHGGYATYGERIYNPEFNVDLAYNQYYKKRGWRPWNAVRGILW